MLLDLDAIFDPDQRRRPHPESSRTETGSHTNRGWAAEVTTPADLSVDWRLMWDERAAILEFDGGLTRELAEHRALVEVMQQMSEGHRG